MSNYKFRASYTVLNMWASGNWEMAVKAYFKLEKFITPAMLDGRDWHKKWSAYITQNKQLPPELGGRKLTNPICEQKRVIQIEPWLELVYIMDCYDKPILHEFKTGKSSSEQYAGDMQIRLYSLGAILEQMPVTKAEIHHYDQYLKKYDNSIVWITKKTTDDALNWLITLSGEMHDYFMKNELYQRYGANLLKQNE